MWEWNASHVTFSWRCSAFIFWIIFTSFFWLLKVCLFLYRKLKDRIRRCIQKSFWNADYICNIIQFNTGLNTLKLVATNGWISRFVKALMSVDFKNIKITFFFSHGFSETVMCSLQHCNTKCKKKKTCKYCCLLEPLNIKIYCNNLS